MKIIQIIGKYKDETPSGRKVNIAKAEDATRNLLRKGYMAICPHLNTGKFILLCPESQFYEGYKETIRRAADCVFVLKNFKTSKGSLGEIEVAIEKGIPIYYNMKDVPDLTC